MTPVGEHETGAEMKPQLVQGPDLADVLTRYRAIQDEHQRVRREAWIGALVLTFSNEEIHLLCARDVLCIGDVLDLRRLGLLAPDEGWTG